MASEIPSTTGGPPYTTNTSSTLPSHQQAILTACRTGDVALLQHHFHALNIPSSSAPVEPTWHIYPSRNNPVPTSGPPATSTLLATAIKHSQPTILALLLEYYPTVTLEPVLALTFSNPNLEVLKILYAHDPEIRDHEFESGETALMVACRDSGGNPDIPNFLLDKGADSNESGIGLLGPLIFAIRYEQPISVVKKMVAKGARVWSGVVLEAVRTGSWDVATWLLKECEIADEEGLETYVRNEVEKCEDDGIKGAFERRIGRKRVTER